MPNRAMMKIGAGCFLLALPMMVLTQALHPYENDPSNSLLAFREYAEHAQWITVHIAQFFAALLVIGGLLALYDALAAEGGYPAALARLGAAAATATLGILAVLQAVDASALKFVVDRWAQAPAAEQAAAFQLAEAVRWVEIGVNGFFRMLLGLTLLLYGLAIGMGGALPRWLGWGAVLIGLGSVAHGVAVAHLGFSPRANAVGMLPGLLTLPWMAAVGVVMWRRGRHSPPAAFAPGVAAAAHAGRGGAPA